MNLGNDLVYLLNARNLTLFIEDLQRVRNSTKLEFPNNALSFFTLSLSLLMFLKDSFQVKFHSLSGFQLRFKLQIYFRLINRRYVELLRDFFEPLKRVRCQKSTILILCWILIMLLNPWLKVPTLFKEVYLRPPGLIKEFFNFISGILVPKESSHVIGLLPELIILLVLCWEWFHIGLLALHKLYNLLCLVYFPKQPLIYWMVL